jgi:hypothetical protein
MNRRERRYADKLSKKSNKELKKELNKMFPNDNRKIQGEMSYQQFIDSVKITPEMLNEINEYEREQRTNHPIQFNLG